MQSVCILGVMLWNWALNMRNKITGEILINPFGVIYAGDRRQKSLKSNSAQCGINRFVVRKMNSDLYSFRTLHKLFIKTQLCRRSTFYILIFRNNIQIYCKCISGILYMCVCVCRYVCFFCIDKYGIFFYNPKERV